MKKLIICFILIAFNSIAVSANEKDYSEMEHNDYTEEIEMFQKYYDNSESYIFQDQEGNDIGVMYGVKGNYSKRTHIIQLTL